ncbi:hypothetical protein FH608_022955 [Nonomuraea phyllanthi]|uniref:Uncharacterized protein n=1 Tax=Nonomuraea phyllanthi TaxID=2219224 RepID=A0A5C4WE53_9ACTN|nr:hypothetical protein [Nonomuraea phyllanthi]KAB8193167.1 hypothetical protein FH608_022955 [Nonomuraea phyllanthi]QFY10971.1 hypothetical protein GBF35_34105 [Nonomuraea phyllanthi]
MRRPKVTAGLAAITATVIAAPVVLLPQVAYASAQGGGTSLIGDVIIFNDEIVEPVSLPVSTCGALLPVLAKSPSTCEGASRVSDDDA